jgi:hypothetical protein
MLHSTIIYQTNNINIPTVNTGQCMEVSSTVSSEYPYLMMATRPKCTYIVVVPYNMMP